MKYASIDIETTGLLKRTDNCLNCDILSFGCVLDDLKNPQPIKELPRYHCYFVNDIYKGEPYALSLHSEIFRRIAERSPSYNYIRPNRFGSVFKNFLIKHGYSAEHDRVTINVAGKNFAVFDYPYLMEKTDINKHVLMRRRFLDPGILMLDFENDEAIPSMKECLMRIGIDREVNHTAIDDAIDNILVIRNYFLG
ncbi:MAG: hypothetical protein ACOC5T_02055 [Elusimicrobiota bacterium]